MLAGPHYVLTLCLRLVCLSPFLFVAVSKDPTLAVSEDPTSPWCKNASAAAEVGMYPGGPIGAVVGLVGPEREGVYVDVPLPVAQLFNQGLLHYWGFNQIEACRNFETAARLDPGCALCYWGVTVCNGPNLQLHTMAAQLLKINQAAPRAHMLAQKDSSLSVKTRRLIDSAMAVGTELPDRPPYETRRKYARVVCAPMEGNVSDADIDAICGGAIMGASFYNYYGGVHAGGTYPMKYELLEAKDRLLSAVKRGRDGAAHPQATHSLIHLMEPSMAPPQNRWMALPSAKQQLALVPTQGHLSHMPGHLFLRVGLYSLDPPFRSQDLQRYSDFLAPSRTCGNFLLRL
jgi:hypothetical protein